MNKILFYSGLAILSLTLFGLLLAFLSQFSVSVNTADTIVAITLHLSLIIGAGILMVLGLIGKDDTRKEQ